MRTIIGLFIAAATVAGIAAGTACNGGGDALTLEEYFEQLDDIDAELEERSSEIDDEFEDLFGEDADPAADIDDDTRDRINDAVESQLDAFDDFISGLEDLEPPDEVADLHEEAIDLSQEFREQVSDAVDEAQDADTFEDFFTFFEDLDTSEVDAVCVELEEIAADNDIEVDLNCEDE